MFRKNSVSRAILGIIISLFITISFTLFFKWFYLRFNFNEDIYLMFVVFSGLLTIFPLVIPILIYCAIDLDELKESNIIKSVKNE